MTPEMRMRIAAVAATNKWSAAQAARELIAEALDARDSELVEAA